MTKPQTKQKTARKTPVKSKGYSPCDQHKTLKDPKLRQGVLNIAATILKRKKFRISFRINNNLHCAFKGSPKHETVSFTPLPRHPKINRRYVDLKFGIGKSCLIILAGDTSIKDQGALNVIYNFKTQSYKDNPGISAWNKFCN